MLFGLGGTGGRRKDENVVVVGEGEGEGEKVVG